MLKLSVPNMACGHCAGTIEKTVKSVDPNATVQTDVTSRVVTIESGEDASKFSEALVDAGYPNNAS